ncbi:hypothetical protein H3S83_07115 [Bartonella sp. W8122]|uniref:hypothetical protein n=1 Tax=Bartonella sp. W8122 TaxID=2750930 RepID=UPI0018DC9F00|nr:hypothetical protein [Bartonella sp. W8122]MBI0001600.1 hypothetical protein [Bartonella sp. W8122]MBI0024882.1 hypothetical protein [Bartonella apihabitans]
MRRFQSALTLSTLALLTMTTVPISAWAVDPNAFTSRLEESAKSEGLSISSTKSEADGNDIVLRDVTIKVQGERNIGDQIDQSSPSDKQSKEPDENVSPTAAIVFDKIDSLRFKNVTEDQDGNYYAENVSIPALKGTISEVTFNLKDISIDKIRLVSGKNKDPLFLYFPYESLAIGQIYSSYQDQIFLNVEALKAIYLWQPDRKRMDLVHSVKSFSYEPDKIYKPVEYKWIKDLGYDKLSGSLNFHANWDSDNGKFVADHNEITIDNAGKLEFSINLDGITEDLINNVYKIQNAKQQKTSNQTDDDNAKTLILLGIVQQLKIGNINLRYEDNSLVNRILDYYAKQNTVTRDDFIKQILESWSLIGAKIDDPEFIKSTSEQIEIFLHNPKSLSISGTPEAAVPLPIAYMAAVTSGAKFIDLFKIKVDANK